MMSQKEASRERPWVLLRKVAELVCISVQFTFVKYNGCSWVLSTMYQQQQKEAPIIILFKGWEFTPNRLHFQEAPMGTFWELPSVTSSTGHSDYQDRSLIRYLLQCMQFLKHRNFYFTSNTLCSWWNINVQQFFNSQGITLFIAHHRNVIQTVHVGQTLKRKKNLSNHSCHFGDDLILRKKIVCLTLHIRLVFHKFFSATVQKTDMRIGS